MQPRSLWHVIRRFSQKCCPQFAALLLFLASLPGLVLAADSSGRFIQPLAGSTANGNLFLAIEGSDADGIAKVHLSLNQNAELVLCQGEIACGGTQFSKQISNLDPGTFQQVPGALQLQLWLTDRLANTTSIATVSLSWQPPQPGDLQTERSADGKQLTVKWEASPTALRYNLYLASVSGVNRSNYRQLTDGRALLAQKQTTAQFNGLDPLKPYYLLLTALTGAGETALAPEINIDSPLANQSPVAVNDSYSLQNNQTLTVSAAQGLLANDIDADGDSLTVNLTPLTQVQSGTLQLSANGSFSYVPNAGFSGTDSFVYQISDNRGGLAQASVQLTVLPTISGLAGDSLSISGEFNYFGQGEEPAGSQLGTGLYRIGDCIRLVDTRCSVQGRYVESAQSGHVPGQQGNYALILTYPGIGPSPVVARSVTANSNSVQFIRLGQARFDLSLFPDSGGQYNGTFPAVPFADSIGFGAFIGTSASCSGLASNQSCTVGQVGQVPGAEMWAPLDRLSFSIPGSALNPPQNAAPTANNDQYQATSSQSLGVAAPGVLANDTEARALLQGDSLNLRHRYNPGLGSLVALAANEYQQLLYLYPSFGSDIHRIDRSGAIFGPLPRQGEAANDADLDIAAQSFQLKDVRVPQGSLLMFNGETNTTEIYALDPHSGVLLSRLDAAFGSSHVVGGAFNAKTGTLWLLQDNVPASGVGDKVAQLDPVTGQVISSFNLVTAAHSFSVSFGDLHVNPLNGNLLIASSIQGAVAEFSQSGTLLRQFALPAGVGNISGMALSADGKTLWLASTSGEVAELGFANQGLWPSLTATLLQPPVHGTVDLKPDGSFIYRPNAGYTGPDSFTYQLSGAFGGVSTGTVQLDVR